MTIPRLTIALLLTASLAGSAWAQAAENPLAALQAQAEIDQAGEDQIGEFVTQKLAAITGTDAAAGRAATTAVIAAHSGTGAFKRAFTNACLSGIGSSFREEELLPATRLMAVLIILEAPAAEPRFVEALSDPRAAVRAAGAVGLRRIQDKLAASGEANVQRVLAALAEAGAKENTPGALATIYAAMDYTGVSGFAGDKISGTALISLLARRAQLYSQPDVPGFGADDDGLRSALKVTAAVEAPARKQLATAAATMIKYALPKYIAADTWPAGHDERTLGKTVTDRRDALERLIVLGERVLAATVAVPASKPELGTAMQNLDKDALLAGWREWGDVLKESVGQDFAVAAPASDG